MRLRSCSIFACLLACACSSEPVAPAPDAPVSCGSGELLQSDGSCFRTGPVACAAGFVEDARGCMPVLPADTCLHGTMALPGDTACRPVADCGEGTWGNLAVEEVDIFVDAAFAGGASNGSMSAPWPTITEALAAAPDGATIALAAGTYLGPVTINRELHLRGRCAELVHVENQSVITRAAVDVLPGGDGSSVRGLSASGIGYGVVVTGAHDVTLEGLHIHDTFKRGLMVFDAQGHASAVASGLLIERAVEFGVMVAGAELHLSDSEVRGTTAPGGVSAGISYQHGALTGVAGNGTVVGVHVHDHFGVGLNTHNSLVLMDRSVVSDIKPIDTTMEDGYGITVTTSEGYTTGSMTILDSHIARNHEAGIATDHAQLIIEGTTIVDTMPQASDGAGGVAVALQGATPDLGPSALTHSALHDSAGYGLFVTDAEMDVTGTVIRGVTPTANADLFGDAVIAASFGVPTRTSVTHSILAFSERAGLSSFSASVSLAGSQLDCNRLHLGGEDTDHGAFEFDDAGGNTCGCDGAEEPCKLATTELAPPPAPQ